MSSFYEDIARFINQNIFKRDNKINLCHQKGDKTELKLKFQVLEKVFGHKKIS